MITLSLVTLGALVAWTGLKNSEGRTAFVGTFTITLGIAL